MSAPVKLTAVLTHPIQYYAPWFRHIHANAPGLALTVVYATQPGAEQQGVGFDRPFEWDVPLLEGYRSITVRAVRPGDRVDTARFMGVDAPGIGEAILGTEPDVVMIAGWYSISLVRALLACRRHGIPTLYRGDSNLLSGPYGWRRALWSARTKLLLRQFDGFLSPGRRADDYLKHFAAPGYRIFRVPHGVDNALFAGVANVHGAAARAQARARLGLPAGAFVPLFAGKMVERKRPLDLLRAAARLGGGVSVLTAGSGPLDAAMQAEADRLGVDLKAMGFVNQTGLSDAYASADCLVLPSDASETWGLVANEALAAGRPIVVSDEVGCAPDLAASADTGAVFARGNVAQLADALHAIRARKAAGHDWSPACRALVDGYGFDAMTAGLVRACRSVIPRSPGAEPEWSASAQRIVAPCGQMVLAGGLERMTFEVLRVLHDQGMATHAIVNGWENYRITSLAESSGASWSVGPYWHSLTRRRITPAVIFRMLLEIVRVSGDLLRVSRRVRPTHVLVPDFLTALRNFPGLAWLRMRGVRVIARLGTAPPPGTFYRHLWRRLIDPLVDVFVANSDFTRRELLAHGISPAKVTTIPNVAPSRRQPPVEAARIPGRIVFVGQIIPDKGLDLLLDAIGVLRGRGLEATLDIVGAIDGWEAPEHRGYRATQIDRAGQPDLAGAVQFLGLREDVPSLLSRASLHCCPSRPEHREGFGIVVLEAKIAGVPSVVTPSGNLPEMIDHQRDGWVCPGTDARVIAEGLEYFLTRPDELAAAGHAALASSSRYSDQRFAAAWTRLFAPSQIEPAHAT